MIFYIGFARNIQKAVAECSELCLRKKGNLERRFIRKLSFVIFFVAVLYWNTEHRQNRFFHEKSGGKCFHNISVSVNFAALIQFLDEKKLIKKLWTKEIIAIFATLKK